MAGGVVRPGVVEHLPDVRDELLRPVRAPLGAVLADVQLGGHRAKVHRGLDDLVVVQDAPVLRVHRLVERPRVLVRHKFAQDAREKRAQIQLVFAAGGGLGAFCHPRVVVVRVAVGSVLLPLPLALRSLAVLPGALALLPRPALGRADAPLAAGADARQPQVLHAEVVVVHALLQVLLALLVRHVGGVERLLVVRRLEAIRLHDAEHVLHHGVRLELRAEALVHANQAVLVVDVEPAVLALLLLVPAVHHHRRAALLGQILGRVVLELVVLERQPRDGAPRLDELAAQRERHRGP